MDGNNIRRQSVQENKSIYSYLSPEVLGQLWCLILLKLDFTEFRIGKSGQVLKGLKNHKPQLARSQIKKPKRKTK